MSTHTQTPYKWGWRDDEDAPGSIFAEPRTGQAYAVAMCPRYGKKNWEADATFIVRACNNHNNLLSSLRMLYEEQVDYITLNHLGDPHHNQSMQMARAALKSCDP